MPKNTETPQTNLSRFVDLTKGSSFEITSFDPDKERKAVTLKGGRQLSAKKYVEEASKALEDKIYQERDVDFIKFVSNVDLFVSDLYSQFRSVGIKDKSEKVIIIPSKFGELVLNMDTTHEGREAKFFLTNKKDIASTRMSGSAYIKLCGMSEADAIAVARAVIPVYEPREPTGIYENNIDDSGIPFLNQYIPPAWLEYDDETPDELPLLFERLVEHLFPIPEEREFFFHWVYCSLFERAFTYLILCGLPGSGKNVMKLVLRALHGHDNTIDGKKSTLNERFNSQLDRNTFVWFDELHYTQEMENAMKEIQNDTVSIERKGVDATRSTKIHSSCVISNNKPRDNFIAFDARKFAPLVVVNKRLEKSLSPAKIDRLVSKILDPQKDTFDVAFLAQIGRWIKKHGYSDKWPRQEYKGPMFYRLAHTSMSRWQKKLIQVLMDVDTSPLARKAIKNKQGHVLWSSLEDGIMKKNGDRGLSMPDYTSVEHFLKIFVDGNGRTVFKTHKEKKSMLGDFWIEKLEEDFEVFTVDEVMEMIGGDDEAEELDL